MTIQVIWAGARTRRPCTPEDQADPSLGSLRPGIGRDERIGSYRTTVSFAVVNQEYRVLEAMMP